MDNDEQPPHNNHGGSLRLPLFWAENSEAWFGIAESRFRLRNIEDEQVKFDLVVNALPKECLRTVLDLVTNPPEEDAYEAIKERLCDSNGKSSIVAERLYSFFFALFKKNEASFFFVFPSTQLLTKMFVLLRSCKILKEFTSFCYVFMHFWDTPIRFTFVF
jgi:hypothetical protein